MRLEGPFAGRVPCGRALGPHMRQLPAEVWAATQWGTWASGFFLGQGPWGVALETCDSPYGLGASQPAQTRWSGTPGPQGGRSPCSHFLVRGQIRDPSPGRAVALLLEAHGSLFSRCRRHSEFSEVPHRSGLRPYRVPGPLLALALPTLLPMRQYRRALGCSLPRKEDHQKTSRWPLVS